MILQKLRRHTARNAASHRSLMQTLWVLTAALAGSAAVAAAGLETATKLFVGGNYAEAIVEATQGTSEAADRAEWPLLLARALNQIGRSAEARQTIVKAVERFPLDLALRLEA